jgi:hypothetical protein
MNNKIKTYIVIGISIAAFVAMGFVGPLAQDPNYHAFADARRMYDVPNFWNVVTNFPFCVIGILGVNAVINSRPGWSGFKSRPVQELNLSCYVFFIGIFFCGIGSAYYHWNPNSATLVWDRLPMTIAFMGFFSLLIGDSISTKAGKQVLIPFVLIGLMSIVYWKFSGDLRLYAIVQFLPGILAPLMLLFYKQQSGLAKYYWTMILFYALAKIFEACDKQIFTMLDLSGHSLKHLFAAMVPLTLWLGLRKKQFNS